MNKAANSTILRPSLKFTLGSTGLFLSTICSVVLLLAMAGVIEGFDKQIMHQSGIRWLSEGAVAGLLIAAFAFWKD